MTAVPRQRPGPRGWDAGKKVRGRKRHIVVDTLGFLLAVLAHPADIQDRPGAVSLLPRLQGVVSRLAILYADSGYAGPMVETACQALGGCHLITIAKDAAARCGPPDLLCSAASRCGTRTEGRC